MAGDGFWGGGNIVDPITLAGTGGAQPSETDPPSKVLVLRSHPVIQARCAQLALNLLALHGGRPYIEARLSRYAGESKAEWEGATRKDGSKVTGRKQRTHNMPILRRMVNKLNQYVFQTAPDREGADPLVLADINRHRLHINRFMHKVVRLVAAHKWCWIGVDVPMMGEGEAVAMTQAQKDASGVRPYWTIYNAAQVVDWEFDSQGVLKWALCEGVQWAEGESAAVVRSQRRVRKLWEPGKLTTLVFDKAGKEIEKTTVTPLMVAPGKPLEVVPLIPVGEIDDEPHEFDDMEGLQRTILDLESANRENFFKAVYAQKYLPRSAVENAKNAYKLEGEDDIAMIFGLCYPIIVGEGESPPGIIMPNSSAIGMMRTELTELKDAMKECFGMMMQKQTRQVESAEAKAWDHLDVEAVISSYADTLEDGETKAVALSAAWDADFQVWTPKYSRDFDVGDFKGEVETMLLADSMQQPASMRRAIRRKVMDRLDRIGARLTDEERAEIIAEIDDWNPDPLMVEIDSAEGVA